MPIPDDSSRAYAADGFVIARQLYDGAQMQRWRTELTSLIGDGTAVSPSGVTVWMLPGMPAFFLDAFAAEPMVGAVKAILGPRIEFLSAKPVVKTTVHRFASPWHQDYAYWGGCHKLSVWIAIDPATPENGCLRVVRGGHRAFLAHANLIQGNGFENQLAEDQLPDGEIVDCVMQPGDAVFFHDLLPHCSYPNPAGLPRWCLIPTYRDATAGDTSKVWAESLNL